MDMHTFIQSHPFSPGGEGQDEGGINQTFTCPFSLTLTLSQRERGFCGAAMT